MLGASVISLIPCPFEFFHCDSAVGHPADLLQYHRTDFLAVLIFPSGLYIQGFEQDILFAVHNRQCIFRLRGV